MVLGHFFSSEDKEYWELRKSTVVLKTKLSNYE